MLRLILILIIVLLSSMNLSAQQIAIKTGGGVHQQIYYDSGNTGSTFYLPVSEQKQGMNFQLGADIGFRLKGRHWLYTGIGFDFYRYQYPSIDTKSFQTTTIVIPILYRYQFDKLGISAGLKLSNSIWYAEKLGTNTNGTVEYKYIKVPLSYAYEYNYFFKPFTVRFNISPSYDITPKWSVFCSLDFFTFPFLIWDEDIEGVRTYCYWVALGIKYNLYKPEKYFD